MGKRGEKKGSFAETGKKEKKSGKKKEKKADRWGGGGTGASFIDDAVLDGRGEKEKGRGDERKKKIQEYEWTIHPPEGEKGNSRGRSTLLLLLFDDGEKGVIGGEIKDWVGRQRDRHKEIEGASFMRLRGRGGREKKLKDQTNRLSPSPEKGRRRKATQKGKEGGWREAKYLSFIEQSAI